MQRFTTKTIRMKNFGIGKSKHQIIVKFTFELLEHPYYQKDL